MLHLSISRAPKKPTVRRSFGSSALLAAALSVSVPAGATPILTEEEGTRQVCSRGPSVALARALGLQGMAQEAAAEVLPNPSLIAEHQRTLTGPEESETIVGLSVPFGVSGRRSLLREAAASRRDQSFADGDATLFASALSFREAYLTALLDQARARILGEQQAALEASSVTIEALARGGEVAGYDLLRQRVQARLHRGSVDSAQARALASRAALEAWTQAEVELPELDLAVLADAAAVLPSTTPRVPTPGVQSLRASSRAHGLEARAARRRWVPDPEVFAGYRALEGGGDMAHGVALGLTLPLTFFDHGQGEAARADAERAVTEAAAEELELRQRAEAKSARARLAELSSGISNLGQARQDAQELLRQAQRLYSAGESSITEMLEAFRVAEEARLAELERIFEIALTRLLVMRASGTMFDASLDQACMRPEQRKP